MPKLKNIHKIKKMWKEEQNKYLKRVAINAYMISKRNKYTPPTAESPLSGFYHRVDDADYIMEQILNMRYGDDAGHKRRKSGGRKSAGRKKSGGRKSAGRKKSGRKKSGRRKSAGRKKSGGRKSAGRKKSR